MSSHKLIFRRHGGSARIIYCTPFANQPLPAHTAHLKTIANIPFEPGGYSLRNQAKGMLEVLRLAVCSEFDSRVSVRPSNIFHPLRLFAISPPFFLSLWRKKGYAK